MIYQDEVYNVGQPEKDDDFPLPPPLPSSTLNTSPNNNTYNNNNNNNNNNNFHQMPQFKPVPPVPLQTQNNLSFSPIMQTQLAQKHECQHLTSSTTASINQTYLQPVLNNSHNNSHYVQVKPALNCRENQINITDSNQVLSQNSHPLPSTTKINKNIYESTTLNVKYLIDINDLKAHLNNSSHTTTTTANTQVTSLASILSSKADLMIHEQNKNDLVKASKNKDKKNEKIENKNRKKPFFLRVFQCFFCCLGKPLYYLIRSMLKCFHCFFACFFKPCCNTASVLAVLFAFIGLMVGIVCMNAIGMIKLPQEITNNICNATHERNNYFFHYNSTVIKEIDRNKSNLSGKK